VLAERRGELGVALEHGAPLLLATELLHNDLQRAAVSLCPEIADALRQAREAGAELSLVSGSGPTVIGLFAGNPRPAVEGPVLAEEAAARLHGREPAAICARPVGAAFARAMTVGASLPGVV
jgi:4-diphosphocytidyl-2-C-methyl-D-erythritol kinase